MSEKQEYKTKEAKFIWVSIGGADAEPAELVEIDGRKGLMTMGCPDPFWFDVDSPVITVFANELPRPAQPETPAQRAKRQAKQQAEYETYQRTKPAGHSWRGPR